MNHDKARILDDYVSTKILSGPWATSASREAAAALKADTRYRRLEDTLRETGFFDPAPLGFWLRVAVTLGLVIGSFALLARAPSWPVRVACCATLGFAAVQGCFLSHEAAHGSLGKRPALVQLVGQVLNTLIVGYCFGYFRRSHDLHHYHVNEEGTDPDTVSTLFSVFASGARTKRGLGRWMTRFQHLLIPALYPMWALAMKWDSMTYVARNADKTRLEQVFLALHVLLWFGLGSWLFGPAGAAFVYLGWCAFAGIYLGVIIPPNHVGMPSIGPDERLPFLEQQLRTSRNLPSSRVLDYVFIGLNCQVEHHLFPWVPSHRLHLGRPAIRAFCVELGLPYHEQAYGEAVADVMRHFHQVAQTVDAPVPAAQPAEEIAR